MESRDAWDPISMRGIFQVGKISYVKKKWIGNRRVNYKSRTSVYLSLSFEKYNRIKGSEPKGPMCILTSLRKSALKILAMLEVYTSELT